MNPEAAMQDGAPLIYDSVPNNIGARWDASFGDVDAAFAKARRSIGQGAHPRAAVAGVPMEPRGVGAPDSTR